MRPSPHAALTWLSAHRSEARHTLRVSCAVAVAYALYVSFGLPQGYWSVFTTLIVMQASIGGTVGAAVDRMYGTVMGAAVGGLLAWLRPQTAVGLGAALVLASVVTVYIATLRPNMKVAPVTAAIMLLSSAGKLGPLQAAGYRVVEIALGSFIGVGATLLIFPARSRTVVAERTAQVLRLFVELLGHYREWLRTAEVEPAADLHPLHDQVRAAIAAVEAAVADTERERAARLGYHHLSPATRAPCGVCAARRSALVVRCVHFGPRRCALGCRSQAGNCWRRALGCWRPASPLSTPVPWWFGPRTWRPATTPSRTPSPTCGGSG